MSIHSFIYEGGLIGPNVDTLSDLLLIAALISMKSKHCKTNEISESTARGILIFDNNT